MPRWSGGGAEGAFTHLSSAVSTTLGVSVEGTGETMWVKETFPSPLSSLSSLCLSSCWRSLPQPTPRACSPAPAIDHVAAARPRRHHHPGLCPASKLISWCFGCLWAPALQKHVPCMPSICGPVQTQATQRMSQPLGRRHILSSEVCISLREGHPLWSCSFLKCLLFLNPPVFFRVFFFSPS